MVTVMLSHEVKNFDDWKVLFDSDEANRASAGLNMHGVFQAHDNPNKVTIIGEAPSAEAVFAFVSNPALKEAMEKGGVISAPEMKILSKVN